MFGGNTQKGPGGETRPSQGQRADLLRLRVGKEDPLFCPGEALSQQGKDAAAEGMKRMRVGKGMLSIRGIRCS